MIKKVLIANRGEIALRIIRACNEMQIQTVAIYAKGEEMSLHVQLADEAICVGKAGAKDSYLNMTSILSAAVATGCDAVHPGFGFLSENETFAKRVAECGMKFIGPKAEVISKMGDKAEARTTAIAAKVPVVPGSKGIIKDEKEGLKIAHKIGYPVLIKAVNGGGGRGMRVAHNAKEFPILLKTAQMEAEAAFGDGTVYLEKFIENPRHIEFQILADQHGNVIHLGERDCSIQRRNQKVVEEAPSFLLTEKLRKKMGEDSIKLAKAVDYENAGTIEFLVDRHDNYYFIEMNTRIQVEHPVTEMITGVDIVKLQLKIASGEPLPMGQKDVVIKGHAIECRINAEDPENHFQPSPGKIDVLMLPGGNGVRLDSAVYPGYVVSPHYDSMIAKLVVYADTREEAVEKMRRALEETVILPIKTNIDFQYQIMNDKDFKLGIFDTSFIASKWPEKVE
ncbi:MAG: acetyl-CoA carboxylase biotin carboxylase subunit [Culicoidibacterales bacterium]